MNKLLMILTLTFATNVYAQDFNVDFYDVKYVRNYDGDTINFDIIEGIATEFALPDALREKLAVIPNQIRLNNIDTAEMRPRKKGKQTEESKALIQCEKLIAKKAQKFVEISLQNATVIHLKSCSKGKYYRMVCDVFYDDKNLALELLNLKYGYIYDGGTKAKYDWCSVN